MVFNGENPYQSYPKMLTKQNKRTKNGTKPSNKTLNGATLGQTLAPVVHIKTAGSHGRSVTFGPKLSENM
jgi:hypothetical protein